VGEWIQIRNRKGEPEEKVVALPVKDPFHVTRVFIHIINCLERLAS
jgi:N-acylglucosamine 2-epimerase